MSAVEWESFLLFLVGSIAVSLILLMMEVGVDCVFVVVVMRGRTLGVTDGVVEALGVSSSDEYSCIL